MTRAIFVVFVCCISQISLASISSGAFITELSANDGGGSNAHGLVLNWPFVYLASQEYSLQIFNVQDPVATVLENELLGV